MSKELKPCPCKECQTKTCVHGSQWARNCETIGWKWFNHRPPAKPDCDAEFASALAHIDFLIERDTREDLGITGRELSVQVLRLCGGFNALIAENKALIEQVAELKKKVQNIIDTGNNNNDEQETIYYVEQATLYDIIE